MSMAVVQSEEFSEQFGKAGRSIENAENAFGSLANILSDRYGRGFSRTNIASMRWFYLVYKEHDTPIVQSGIAQLASFQRNGILLTVSENQLGATLSNC